MNSDSNEKSVRELDIITTAEVSAQYGVDRDTLIAACAPQKGKYVIFEPGCGDKLSVSLGPRDVWVGVDPDTIPGSRIKRGENKVGESSKRFFIAGKLDEIPESAYPDVILMVAPNPDDINYRGYLNEIRDKMKRGRTVFLAVLDTESYESQADPVTFEMTGYGLRKAKEEFRKVFEDMAEIRFFTTTNEEISLLRDEGIPRTVHINSNFLFGKRKSLVLVTPVGGRR